MRNILNTLAAVAVTAPFALGLDLNITDKSKEFKFELSMADADVSRRFDPKRYEHHRL
jgi:hypothetical protein